MLFRLVCWPHRAVKCRQHMSSVLGREHTNHAYRAWLKNKRSWLPLSAYDFLTPTKLGRSLELTRSDQFFHIASKELAYMHLLPKVGASCSNLLMPEPRSTRPTSNDFRSKPAPATRSWHQNTYLLLIPAKKISAARSKTNCWSQ